MQEPIYSALHNEMPNGLHIALTQAWHMLCSSVFAGHHVVSKMQPYALAVALLGQGA